MSEAFRDYERRPRVFYDGAVEQNTCRKSAKKGQVSYHKSLIIFQ